MPNCIDIFAILAKKASFNTPNTFVTYISLIIFKPISNFTKS